MEDSARAVLKSVQAVLKASSLSAYCADRVYGAIPVNPIFPFVLVTAQSSPFSSQSFVGMEHTVSVQCFAEDTKPAKVLAMREIALNALSRNEVNLALPNNQLVLCEFDGVARAFLEPDGKTYQAIVEFKVIAI